MSILKIVRHLKDAELLEGIDLSKYSTIKLKAKGNIIIVKSLQTLKDLLPLLSKNKINYRVLGIGANQVLSGGSDLYYLKLKFDFDQKYLENIQEEYTLPASVPLSLLTNHAKQFSLKKWDLMTGIPATLGGAVFMNAGISQGDISEIVSKVKIVKIDGSLKEVSIDDSSFSYRKNHFIEPGEVIFEVVLKNLGTQSDIKSQIETYIRNRDQTQPWKQKTCGCVFKNYSKTCRAGQYIDILGLKGLTYKGLKISNLHGNFFVNFGEAKTEDFIYFVKLIQEELYLQYGIKFELEVQLA